MEVWFLLANWNGAKRGTVDSFKASQLLKGVSDPTLGSIPSGQSFTIQFLLTYLPAKFVSTIFECKLKQARVYICRQAKTLLERN